MIKRVICCLCCIALLFGIATAESVTLATQSRYRLHIEQQGRDCEMIYAETVLKAQYNQCAIYPLAKTRAQSEDYEAGEPDIIFYSQEEYSQLEAEGIAQGLSHEEIYQQLGRKESGSYCDEYDPSRPTYIASGDAQFLGYGQNAYVAVRYTSLQNDMFGNPAFYDLRVISWSHGTLYTTTCRGILPAYYNEAYALVLEWLTTNTGLQQLQSAPSPTPSPTPSPSPSPTPKVTSEPTVLQDIVGTWVYDAAYLGETHAAQSSFTFREDGSFSCTTKGNKLFLDTLYTQELDGAGTYTFKNGNLHIIEWTNWRRVLLDPDYFSGDPLLHQYVFEQVFDQNQTHYYINTAGTAMSLKRRECDIDDWIRAQDESPGGAELEIDPKAFIPNQIIKLDENGHIGIRLVYQTVFPLGWESSVTAAPTATGMSNAPGSIVGDWRQDIGYYTNELTRPEIAVSFDNNGNYSLYLLDGDYIEGLGFTISYNENGQYLYENGVLLATKANGAASVLDGLPVASNGEKGMYLQTIDGEYHVILTGEATVLPAAAVPTTQQPISEASELQDNLSPNPDTAKHKTDTSDQITADLISHNASEVSASHYITRSITGYEPSNACDGDETTSWQFSAKDVEKLSDCYLELTYAKPIDVDQFWIKNGFWKVTNNLDQYTRNGRPKRIELDFLYEGADEYGDALEIELEDDKRRNDWQRFDIGNHHSVCSIRIRIMSYYKGSKFKTDICISEVMFLESKD